MTSEDITSLNIILSLTELQFIAWFHTASSDDRAYTIDLLARVRVELSDYSDDQIPTVDLSQASTALKKYMLNN